MTHTPDSVRNLLVKTSAAVFKPIETILESSGSGDSAQKLRKLQHQCIGLTEDQWQYIADYFGCEELAHMASQGREKALFCHDKLTNQPPVNDSDPVEMERYKGRLDFYEQRIQVYKDQISATEGAMSLLKIKMGYTPLYRAMIFHQRDSNSHLTKWLQDRCAANEGCCGRSCGCCEKIRGTTLSRGRFNHCTVMCLCCERYHNRNIRLSTSDSVYQGQVHLISRKAKGYLRTRLTYTGGLEFRLKKFNPREERKDKNSALLMNAYVWGLDLRKEGEGCQF